MFCSCRISILTSASSGPFAIAEPLVNFGIRGIIADVITDASFFVNRFRAFGVLTPPQPRNFAISIGLAGRSYNSVSTAVLHCDTELHYTN